MRHGTRNTIVIGAVLFALAPLAAVAADAAAKGEAIQLARAGTLQKCEGVSTANGYKYVGTYCMDYQCTYVQRYVFDSYCPYSI